MEAILDTLLANPILGILLVGLIVTLGISIIKKLLKIAIGISIIIIALAIVLHYFGHDTLPQEGKEVLQKAGEVLP